MPVQIILDGPRNVVVKITESSVITAGTAIDVSALDPPCTRVNINQVWFSLLDAEAFILLWDATTDEPIINLHGQQDFCFDRFGGLTNNAGAGITGDVLYTSPAGPSTVVLFCTKHGVIDTPL